MSRRHDPAKEQLWRQRFQRFAASDLTVLDFCADEGVPPASFYYWRKRLRLDPHTDPAAEQPTSFLPVHLLVAAPLEIALPSGLTLRINSGCDPQLLATVLTVLGVTSC